MVYHLIPPGNLVPVEVKENLKNIRNLIKNQENCVTGNFPIKNPEEKEDNCLICFHKI